ncbi:MAG: ABC transporter ATP-binding protein, partial [Parabacteroides sp.]
MNETILNGLLNLFALFASTVKIDKDTAYSALNSYLSSHFGVRSHKDYLELYNELRDMYDDSHSDINKRDVIRNICEQMKIKLRSDEQLLLLIRFIEFAYVNSREFNNHIQLFHLVADIFSISNQEFNDILAFITGGPSTSS